MGFDAEIALLEFDQAGNQSFQIGARRLIGRNLSPLDLLDQIAEYGMVNAELVISLTNLAQRGHNEAWDEAASIGIQGWLDPAEAFVFAHALNRLPLPETGSDPSRLDHYQIPAGAGGFAWTVREEDRFLLALAFIRTFALAAAESQTSLIWGHDLPRFVSSS